MSSRVLVVEDEPVVRELVTFHLARAGFRVLTADSAQAAWELVDSADVVVLDWMLPDTSGLDWLRLLREAPRQERLPVLMLTARATEMDKVAGLELADDYLVKPFSAAELIARLRALLRRSERAVQVEIDGLLIDLSQGSVSLEGKAIALTRREFELIAFLAAHPGRVFSRTELLDRVWGEDFLGTERTVDQHVAQLRALLGARRIETVRGRGYRLAYHDHG